MSTPALGFGAPCLAPRRLRPCANKLLRALLLTIVLLCRLADRFFNPESLDICDLRNAGMLEDEYEPEYLLHGLWHDRASDRLGHVTTQWASTAQMREIDTSTKLSARVQEFFQASQDAFDGAYTDAHEREEREERERETRETRRPRAAQEACPSATQGDEGSGNGSASAQAGDETPQAGDENVQAGGENAHARGETVDVSQSAEETQTN